MSFIFFSVSRHRHLKQMATKVVFCFSCSIFIVRLAVFFLDQWDTDHNFVFNFSARYKKCPPQISIVVPPMLAYCEVAFAAWRFEFALSAPLSKSNFTLVVPGPLERTSTRAVAFRDSGIKFRLLNFCFTKRTSSQKKASGFREKFLQ